MGTRTYFHSNLSLFVRVPRSKPEDVFEGGKMFLSLPRLVLLLRCLPLVLKQAMLTPKSAQVPWAMPSEIFPSSLRAKGVALATCSNWLNNFIIGLITPPLVTNTGFGAYAFFAVFCLLSLIWTLCFVPETSGSKWHVISVFSGNHLTLPLGTLEAMDQYVFSESGFLY